MGRSHPGHDNSPPSALANALFAIYALALVGLILFKLPFRLEVVANVLAFLPLGIYVCAWEGSPASAPMPCSAGLSGRGPPRS
jgi:hypothetical protein